MAIICWGNLAKSADDVQKIEESIQDYVEGHNENVNAHQIYGSSLYMHRLETKLDHRLGSIDLRYMAENKLMVMTSFNTLDGWQGYYASASLGVLGAFIATAAISDDVAMLVFESVTNDLTLNPSKNPFFQTTVKLGSSSDVEAFVGCGNEPGTDIDTFGFKFVNGTEYVYWTREGEEHTEQISNIVATDINVYRAYIDQDEGKLYFLVNGEVVYTVDEADLPVTPNDYMFVYYLKTTANSLKTIYMFDFLFTQDR